MARAPANAPVKQANARSQAATSDPKERDSLPVTPYRCRCLPGLTPDLGRSRPSGFHAPGSAMSCARGSGPSRKPIAAGFCQPTSKQLFELDIRTKRQHSRICDKPDAVRSEWRMQLISARSAPINADATALPLRLDAGVCDSCGASRAPLSSVYSTAMWFRTSGLRAPAPWPPVCRRACGPFAAAGCRNRQRPGRIHIDRSGARPVSESGLRLR